MTLIIDIETTGLTPGVNGIVSIGGYDFEAPSSKPFYEECRIDDDVEVHPKALEVNGFTQEQIVDPTKLPLVAILTNLRKWAMGRKDRTMGGWNVRFDYDFLNHGFKQYEIKWPFGFRVEDVHSTFYSYLRACGQPRKLAFGASSYGMNKASVVLGLPPEPDPHNALTGAKQAAMLLWDLDRRIKENDPIKKNGSQASQLKLDPPAHPYQ